MAIEKDIAIHSSAMVKQCIEYNKRRAVALKQDREIYLFYLKQNEEEQ